ncbi:hypothetical protein GQ53DRAFT_526940 [Thozetella sp. PMI_491]|nr:hypothetical protein GQ53DRAFT_526940 [Thozetella sp. PMI_491]
MLPLTILIPIIFSPAALGLPTSTHHVRDAAAEADGKFNINDVKSAIASIDTGERDINSASSGIVKAGEAAYASFGGNPQSSLGTLYSNYKKDLASALAYLDKIQAGLDKARVAYQKGGDLTQNFWF